MKNKEKKVPVTPFAKFLRLRDGPSTTTAIFELISRHPMFSILGYPRNRMSHIK